MRAGRVEQVGRGAFEDDLTARAAAVGPEVDDPVRVRDDVEVVLDDQHRAAAFVDQPVQHFQQADAGILPPAPRTDTGYRTFREKHRAALLTYRALQRGYGPEAAAAIMRAVHADDVPLALSLIDSGHAALHEQRQSLKATGEALAAIAEQDTAVLPQSELSIGEAARFLGVRPSALRTWEAAGLLSPQRDPATGYRRFGRIDVRDARMIHMLRQARYPLTQIEPVLDGLRREGSSDALRGAIAHRRDALTRRATAMLEAASHLHHYLGA